MADPQTRAAFDVISKAFWAFVICFGVVVGILWAGVLAVDADTEAVCGKEPGFVCVVVNKVRLAQCLLWLRVSSVCRRAGWHVLAELTHMRMCEQVVECLHRGRDVGFGYPELCFDCPKTIPTWGCPLRLWTERQHAVFDAQRDAREKLIAAEREFHELDLDEI